MKSQTFHVAWDPLTLYLCNGDGICMQISTIYQGDTINLFQNISSLSECANQERTPSSEAALDVVSRVQYG